MASRLERFWSRLVRKIARPLLSRFGDLVKIGFKWYNFGGKSMEKVGVLRSTC